MVYKKFRKNKKGFSLIEIIIVLAIFVLISSVGLFFSFDHLRSQNFVSETRLLVRLLENVRQKSLMNENQNPHGLFLWENSFVLFEGKKFNLDSETNLFFDRNLAIDIETNFSESQIIFKNISGGLDTSGNFLLSDGVRNREISVNQEGSIYFK